MSKKDVCGGDVSGVFNRADFGVNYGEQYGFNQNVTLRIYVEGIKGGGGNPSLNNLASAVDCKCAAGVEIPVIVPMGL